MSSRFMSLLSRSPINLDSKKSVTQKRCGETLSREQERENIILAISSIKKKRDKIRKGHFHRKELGRKIKELEGLLSKFKS